MYVITNAWNGTRLCKDGSFSYYGVPKLFKEYGEAESYKNRRLNIGETRDYGIKPAYIQHEVLFYHSNSEIAEKVLTRLGGVSKSYFFNLTLELNEEESLFEVVATYDATSEKHKAILETLHTIIRWGTCLEEN